MALVQADRHPYHTWTRSNAGSNVSFRDLPLTFAKSAKVKYHATFDSLNVTVTTQTTLVVWSQSKQLLGRISGMS